MEIKQIALVYFSPTQTTKRVLEGMVTGIENIDIIHIDLTLPVSIFEEITFTSHDLVIFGSPVYAGRIPKDSAVRFKQIKGDQTPAVFVGVYGNRAFEDAVLELKNLMEDQGFVGVAGAAFIGEHSYATPEMNIANGRPDDEDLKIACEFGENTISRLLGCTAIEALPALVVPGNFPHRDPMQPNDSSPETNSDLCTLCGICVDVCPTGAITMKDRIQTDGIKCILCCACTRKCPTSARELQTEQVLKFRTFLVNQHSKRKEPQLFF
ncbi:MAG: 4Fe-4S binding protein [Anaerolineaceae bacterium]|nr:4Fe-4S binding protein [Anaerolineaceae bacterium]